MTDSLLREPGPLPPGCYCKDLCAAPVIFGHQTPCRRPGGVPGQRVPDPDVSEAVVRAYEARCARRQNRPVPEGYVDLCDDCPPVGYPTDKTRCAPCPRRKAK